MLKINKECRVTDIDMPTDDTKIARYFMTSKLTKLLIHNQIWFANADQFTDKRERQIPESFFNGMSNPDFYKKINDMKQSRVKAYVSCWTEFEEENFALWKLYDRTLKGACIVTTVGELRKQLNNPNVIIGKVKYPVKEQKGRVNLPVIYIDDDIERVIRGTEFFKISPYEYEKEIRAVFYSKEDVCGYVQEIDAKSLVKEIIINPFADEITFNRVRRKIVRAGIDEAIIKASEIDERQ